MAKNDIDDDDVIKYKKEPCTSNNWSEQSLAAYHSTQNDKTNQSMPITIVYATNM